MTKRTAKHLGRAGFCISCVSLGLAIHALATASSTSTAIYHWPIDLRGNQVKYLSDTGHAEVIMAVIGGVICFAILLAGLSQRKHFHRD